jgi:DNA-binding response OmpR family regulator
MYVSIAERPKTGRLKNQLFVRTGSLPNGDTLAKYSLCDSQPQFMTVLLMEDHADTRSVFEMLLNRCGCQTVTAKSLKDARARLKGMSFDMLIRDLNLPDGDGLDLVCEAKHMHKLKAIALTGRTSDEERDRGLKMGVDCYLTKPIDYQQLKKALRFP